MSESLLQQRHFEFIAEVIATEFDGHQREEVAQIFDRRLRTTNSNYKSARFLKACGVKENTPHPA